MRPRIKIISLAPEVDRLRFEAAIATETGERRFVGIIPGTTQAIAGNLAGRILDRRDFAALAKCWVEQELTDGWLDRLNRFSSAEPQPEILGSVTGYLQHCVERIRRGDHTP